MRQSMHRVARGLREPVRAVLAVVLLGILAVWSVASCSEDSGTPGAVTTEGGAGGTGGGTTGGAGGAGGAGGVPPLPDQLTPCGEDNCWEQDAPLAECGAFSMNEDFSSGLYNVHRWESRLWGQRETEISLTSTGGDWQPAIIVALSDGTVICDGQIGLQQQDLTVTIEDDGTASDTARVHIASDETLDVFVYVTGWQVVESDFVDDLPQDATYRLVIDSQCEDDQPVDAIAPSGFLPGEIVAGPGCQSISFDDNGGAPVRFDVDYHTHVGFHLDYEPDGASVAMEISRYDGAAEESMAEAYRADEAYGERFMAVLDDKAHRTFWVRATGSVTSATLCATYTSFDEGLGCVNGCDQLLQLPLPTSMAADGYGMPGHVRFAWQFGRRDLLMALRHAGRAAAEAAQPAYTIKDLSRADGSSPPNHDSHTLGLKADISLIDDAGNPIWGELCDAKPPPSCYCYAGTESGFGGVQMARVLGAMLASPRVTTVLLDEEYLPKLRAGADQLEAQGELDSAVVARIYADVFHYPSHCNHAHVSVSDDPY